MKRIVLIVAVLAALVNVASAAPVLCGSATVAYYVATYNSLANACQVGDKLFYNFNYSGTQVGGLTPVDATQVNVVGDSSNPDEPGLIFSSTFWTVSSPGGSHGILDLDSSIAFTVQTIDNSARITDASLDFTGGFTVTGTAGADIAERVSPNGVPPAKSFHVDSTGPLSTTVFFDPVSVVTVSKDLVVIIPADSAGTATITSFREGFSENSPEPVGTILIGSGLLAIGLFRRRICKQ
jgi:hypothetical protein